MMLVVILAWDLGVPDGAWCVRVVLEDIEVNKWWLIMD